MKINNAEEFGAALRAQRKSLGYTQKYISDFTGLSVSFLSDLENGKATAELGKALDVAALLGLDVRLDVRGKVER